MDSIYGCMTGFAIAQSQDEKAKPTHCSQGALDDDKVGWLTMACL